MGERDEMFPGRADRAHDDETLILCAALMGATLARDRPDLTGRDRRAALLKGIRRMLEAGLVAHRGELCRLESFDDGTGIAGPLAQPVGSA